MKRSWLIMGAVFLISALILAACGGGGSAAESEGTESYEQPPAEYASMTNPVKGDASAISAGSETYATNCASCHGQTGLGDGPAGASLDPHPGNLQEAGSEASDAYLYWRISEGGAMAPFNSSMPAWKGVLSEDQIWQVVAYIQTLSN
ncbi:MAG: cytochrome c [Chloroflexi bacterium]|jgi:mono/diheme cytochrome c family protein|nr:cytochrome c [Anaerolineaceae bacterium]NMB87247.1 cytochrome c [Chloroflexota bacterium]